MKIIETMLRAHPRASMATESMIEALTSLAHCQQVCLSCADACLEEESIDELRSCIRMNLECAAICSATAESILRQTEGSHTIAHAQLHACALACQACADICALHGEHHEHCRICAKHCRNCQEKCNLLLGEFSHPEYVERD